MRAFRDRPIRQKLMLVTMVTSGSTLVIASALLLGWDFVRERREIQLDLATQAQIIVDNSTAALSFDDSDAAGETLSTLRSKPQVREACIYARSGRVLATYSAGRDPYTCPAPRGDEIDSSSGELILFKRITLLDQPLGTLYMRRSLNDLRARLRVQAGVVSCVLLASGLLAVLMSSALRGHIAGPILQLAGTARAVSDGKDYSVRATRSGRDEAGDLVDAFNGMLEQIQFRDAELLRAQTTLEHRVEERTVQLQQELHERRRTERELEQRNVELTQSNQELDDFAYIASHDLKEPLRGIHNYALFLMEDYAEKLDSDGREKLQTLGRLSQRMEALIDSLLHFSRVGRVDLAMASVDLGEVVADVLDSLQISLRQYGVEVRMPQPLPTIVCDRVRVGEVFHNLATNAMKYNDKPERWIEIGTHPGTPTVFYVRDNGIGIAEKHLDAVFRIFKRLHTRERYGGGTGAGLTIVKKIVERHNGRTWIESALEVGTTVYFTLEQGPEHDA